MAEMSNESKSSVPLSKLAYDELFKRILKVVERNVVPDRFVRMGIDHLLSKRAKEASVMHLNVPRYTWTTGRTPQGRQLFQIKILEQRKGPHFTYCRAHLVLEKSMSSE